jgi:hypothetical protein
MIKVQLNNTEVELKSLDKRVFFDSIQRCLAENMPIILSVVINHKDINLFLSSKDYPNGNGGYRKPNALEQKVFDAWDLQSLNCSRINPHNLFKFLDEIKHYSF